VNPLDIHKKQVLGVTTSYLNCGPHSLTCSESETDARLKRTLAMRTSLAPPMEPPKELDGTDIPPDDRTGWSGDGSPTDTGSYNVLEFPREPRGTLRDFRVGAVNQHFPLTTARKSGDK